MPVVPVNAVLISEGRQYAFVLSGNQVKRRNIKAGTELSDGEEFEITSGLSPGEEVVTAGADAIADGATVRAVRDVDPFSGAKASEHALPPATGPVRD
jgi:hypothetical protein